MAAPLTLQGYGLTLYVVESGHQLSCTSSKDSAIAELGKHIRFSPSALDTYGYDGWKDIHYDLLVVSAAVEFADRRCARRIGQWSREFWITVPVFELAIWRQREVQASLTATLRHLTGDDWHFSFVPLEGTTETGTRQRSLPFGNNKQFAIAYSDGLDSRCVSELCGKGDAAVRVRVAKNRCRIRKGERPFDEVPFRVLVPSSEESSTRSRGFKFAIITVIAAQLSRVSRIVVPESGQGALGPALVPLHNVYSDYRNHPTFFRRMERFVKALLGYTVTYEQPRLWHTKGQTIAAFVSMSGAPEEELFGTRSCWQQRWNAKMGGELRQCGLCAACLLRRMSMHAAGLHESAESYVISDLKVDSFAGAVPRINRLRLSKTMVEYGIVGARHLQQLANIADLPDSMLQGHAFEIARATSSSQQETLEKLRSLLVSHAKEWRAFMADLGERSFLNNWMEGGRYGRSE